MNGPFPAAPAPAGNPLEPAVATAELRADDYPTVRQAIYGRLVERTFPMGPDEAASVAAQAVEDHQAGTLERCACGWYVVICRHHQPWRRA